MQNNIKKIIIAGAIGGTALAMGIGLDNSSEISKELKLKCPKENLLFSEDKGNDVKYACFQNEEVPMGEEIARTENAQFFKVKTNKDGTEVIKAIVYSGANFHKDKNNKWHQVEYATTTKDAFDKQITSFIGTAFAAEVIYSTTSDGFVRYKDDSDWDTTHDAITGTLVSATYIQISTREYATDQWQNQRGFTSFDTSSLPDDAVISSAILYMTSSNGAAGDDDAYAFIRITPSTASSSIQLYVEDYDQAGDIDYPLNLAQDIPLVDIASTTGSTTHEFILNATGTAYISKTDYTKFGVREGHDVMDVANDCVPDCENSANFYTYSYNGTTCDPYLVITYTIAPPVSAMPGFLKLNNSKIIINGGKIIIK